MPAYSYKHGDRPLEGYTIEHAIGRGGFGEVYYAVSDTGRQVALKAVQNYEDIELRGIGHCMNLKSPHLVMIFDVRYNGDGDPFVIMEYVSGPSLRELLDEAPSGLGKQKASYFLREMAEGLSYLHENGVVHRDMKPHNVFFEDGYVKIGDYSLSKVITTSHRSGHTVTVGTVHYMAPEISLGRYDHRVDIYALGVMLYEMLTGCPPYTGDSLGEVLMKHMAGEVNVDAIDEPFATVITRAMAKDPDERYESVQAMVSAVFGAEDVEHSLAAFNPNTLTVVAERIAARSGPQAAAAVRVADRPPPSGGDVAVATPPPGANLATSDVRFPLPGSDSEQDDDPPGFADLAREATQHVATGFDVIGNYLKKVVTPNAVNDPLSLRERWSLVATAMVAVVTFSAILAIDEDGFFPAVGVMLAVPPLLACRGWLTRRRIGQSRPFLRIALAALGCTFLIATTLLMHVFDNNPEQSEMVVGLTLALVLFDWGLLTSPVRPQRVSLSVPLCAAVLAFSFPPLRDFLRASVASMAAGMCLCIQVASPFDPQRSQARYGTLDWFGRLWEAMTGGLRRPDFTSWFHRKTAIKEEMPAVGPPAHIAASPFSRGKALFLACLFPLCGLHRLYAGRIKTGLLWMLTGGMLLVGQGFDVLQLLRGRFRDAAGRVLVNWRRSSSREVAPAGEAVNGYSTIPAAQAVAIDQDRWINQSLGAIGGLVFGVALLLGLTLAVGLPTAIADGVFGTHTAREFHYSFGMADWPRLVDQIGNFLAGVLGVAGLSIVLFARREDGSRHMMRALFGAGGFVATVLVFAEGCYFVRWIDVAAHIDQNRIGPAVDAVINAGRGEFTGWTLLATILFAASLFVLAWPPPRSTPSPNRSNLQEPAHHGIA